MKPKKLFTKQPKSSFLSTPYTLGNIDISEELTFNSQSNIIEDIQIYNKQSEYIDVICSLKIYNEFVPVTVKMEYRNEEDDVPILTEFNLYDNSSIKMNGAVTGIEIVAHEAFIPSEKIIPLKNFKHHTIYKKIFRTIHQPCNLKTHETQNVSGIDTISEVYCFGGFYKPYMQPSEIQQYLFYAGHDYNGEEFIKIISASDFLNSKNTLLPVSDIKLEDLSTLQDDIMSGKLQIVINDKEYKSIMAVKSTLTVPIIFITFKAI